jgi:hypothetical protein
MKNIEAVGIIGNLLILTKEREVFKRFPFSDEKIIWDGITPLKVSSYIKKDGKIFWQFQGKNENLYLEHKRFFVINEIKGIEVPTKYEGKDIVQFGADPSLFGGFYDGMLNLFDEFQEILYIIAFFLTIYLIFKLTQ